MPDNHPIPASDSTPDLLLAGLLNEHADAILGEWTTRLIALRDSHYAGRKHAEVISWTRQWLAIIIQSLHSGRLALLIYYAEKIGRIRFKMGFTIGELIHGMLLLKESALPVLLTARGGQDIPTASISRLDECIRTITASLATHFTENIRRSIVNLAEMLVEEPQCEDVVRAVCHQGRDLTGAAGAAVILSGADDRATVQSAGPDSERALALANVLVPGGDLRVPTGPHIYHEIPPEVPGAVCSGIETAMLVPISVRGSRIGALVLINSPTGFTRDDIRLVEMYLDTAAIVIEYVRLTGEHERVALLEVRQRLARDLHDSISQTLYSITLHAEAADRLAAAGESARAAQNIRELRELATLTLREMRLLVYELRPQILKEEGLVSAIRRRLASVEERAGIATHFICTEIDRLPDNLEIELHRVIHESLNNVLRHARASTITVSLRRSKGSVILQIEDDGSGFEVEDGLKSGGLGLTGMQERAERLGGRLELHSRPGHGTRIRLDVPIE
jgi:signal transduction histidine kinase